MMKQADQYMREWMEIVGAGCRRWVRCIDFQVDDQGLDVRVTEFQDPQVRK